METAASLWDTMHPGDWATSINLRDVYFHLLIHPHDRKWGQSISSVSSPSAWLQPRGFSQRSPENCAFMSGPETSAWGSISMTGWYWPPPGVTLEPLSAGPAPVQQLVFLSQRGEIRPQAFTAVRVPGLDLRHPVMTSLSGPSSHTAPAVPPVFLASQGLGNSTGVNVTPGSDGVIAPLGRLHKRKFQRLFRDLWCQAHQPWDLHIPLGEWFQQSTSQWDKIEWLSLGVPIRLPSPQEHLYTDASVVGWEAHVGSLTASGHWPEHMMSCHINLLELEAAFQTLKQFHHSLAGRRDLHKDNTTVACYINKQGGARSRPLSQRTEELLLWCASRSIQLLAQYVPSKLNILANLLSWPHIVLQSEWTLVHSVLQPIWSARFTPHINLFPTRFSHRLPLYVSPVPDMAAWAVDALSIPWSNLLSYAFSPVPITGKVLRKARDEKATLILVTPHWPAQAWFPELPISVMFHPSDFRWALNLFFSPGQGFRTETQGCCTFTPGFCAGLAVFTRCLLLCALLGGACRPPRHSGRVLRALGQLGQMVCGPFGPAS